MRIGKVTGFVFKMIVAGVVAYYCLYHVNQAWIQYTGLPGLNVNTRLLFSFVMGMIFAWARTI